MTNKTVTIDEREYHALKTVTENAKRDYIAHHAGKHDFTPADEWDAAIEALEALDD